VISCIEQNGLSGRYQQICRTCWPQSSWQPTNHNLDHVNKNDAGSYRFEIGGRSEAYDVSIVWRNTYTVTLLMLANTCINVQDARSKPMVRIPGPV